MFKQMFVPMLLMFVLIIGCNSTPQITPEPKPTETELLMITLIQKINSVLLILKIYTTTITI